jgi:hypothetical protein
LISRRFDHGTRYPYREALQEKHLRPEHNCNGPGRTVEPAGAAVPDCSTPLAKIIPPFLSAFGQSIRRLPPIVKKN